MGDDRQQHSGFQLILESNQEITVVLVLVLRHSIENHSVNRTTND